MFIILFLVIIIFILLCKINSSDKNKKNEIMNSLGIQSARWTIAALQDNNSFIANLHANYGVAYAMALRSIGTDKEIKKATGIEIQKLEKSTINAQRKAAQQLFKDCPNIIPKDDLYLSLLSQKNISN